MSSLNSSVMTLQQQRQSLSAQKKGPLKGLKNVLSQPYQSFWPVVKGEQSKMLTKLISEKMSSIKLAPKKVPWSRLKKMSKEERKLMKTTLKESSSVDTTLMNSAVMGINAVTRSLEKNTLCCVILEANVDPQFLVKHIVVMAQNRKIPVLLIPSLKPVMIKSVGYSTTAVGFKRTVADTLDHTFHIIHEKVLEVFSNFPLPKDKTSSNTHEKDTIEKTEMETQESTKEHVVVSSSVHLYRKSKTERAFIPPDSIEDGKKELENKEFGDFIPLANNDSDDSMEMPRMKRYINIRGQEETTDFKISKGKRISNEIDESSYVPLKIKRVKGNENRVKATKSSKPKKKK